MTRGLPSRDALPPAVRTLLDLLAQPQASARIGLREWDTVLRFARVAQLVGTLSARIEHAGALDACPHPVRDHLRGAAFEARHLAKLAELEVEALDVVLAPLAVPRVLLKGAAYLAAGVPLAKGRLLRDVDLLVPAAYLASVEQALVRAGWSADPEFDAYDQRYYRAWSHQIPPLRRAGRALEVDVHHTILPPTGRIHPDARALVRDARALAGGWSVLEPADQVVHAAVHLFQDSDLASRLREVVDVDGLCRHHAAAEPRFWVRLAERAQLHGAQRPVAYAIAFARAWLGTPVDDDFVARCGRELERAGGRWVVRHAQRALPPADPAETPRAARVSAQLLFLRSLWLRMPPWLLARHALAKAWRARKPG